MHDLPHGFRFTFEPTSSQVVAIHDFLSRSYWATDIPHEVVERSIRNSLCIALLDPEERLAGFARAVTDRATFAYLCDVFIVESHRGLGLGRRMVDSLLAHPDLQGLRRFNLVTRDAHRLYAPIGFRAIAHPDRYMERLDPDVYKRLAKAGDSSGP